MRKPLRSNLPHHAGRRHRRAKPAARFEAIPISAIFRFRALLRERDWASLPAAIRRRFSKRLPPGGSTVYAGEVLETRMNFGGWLLAQALRLIGGAAADRRAACTCRAS